MRSYSGLSTNSRTQEPPNAELLIKAIDGLLDQDFLKRDDTTMLVSEALRRFGQFNETDPAQRAILGKITRGYEADPQKCPPGRRREVADAYSLQSEWAKAETVYRALLDFDCGGDDQDLGLGQRPQVDWPDGGPSLRGPAPDS